MFLFRWISLVALFAIDIADVTCEPLNGRWKDCGLSTGWAANYTAFHNRIIQENDKSGRFLVAVPNLSGEFDVLGYFELSLCSHLNYRL